MRIAFIGNQGGREQVAWYAAMARPLADEFGTQARVAVWLEREESAAADFGIPEAEVSSFEAYVRRAVPPDAAATDAFVRDYRDVNWSVVVAAERAFTDYSMLLGSMGERRETTEYVSRLVTSIARYLETVIAGCDGVVCQTSDTLYSLVVFKVARRLGVPAFATSPAWLLEPGKGGGFFASSEFLECPRMTTAYARRRGRPLTSEERARTDSLVRAIRGFDGNTAFGDRMLKGVTRFRAVTPNVARLPSYVARNSRRDKHVEYIKVDVWNKLRANWLRVVRKRRNRNAFGPTDAGVIPPRSVFFALHRQPEQSTLAQGIWHVNQVALVENISKSLPLGYTLVVKEHPWGRGTRPRWQYDHMAAFYNVLFCDAPSKEIISRVDAVITVTGTVGVEAQIFDKPTILLGRNFYEFSDLLYRVPDIQDLPETLARILIDGDYAKQPDRERRLHEFLMAYLDGLVPFFPYIEHAHEWGRELARELGLTRVDRALQGVPAESR